MFKNVSQYNYVKEFSQLFLINTFSDPPVYVIVNDPESKQH